MIVPNRIPSPLHIFSVYCFESIRLWLIKHTREHGPSIVYLNFDVGMLFPELAGLVEKTGIPRLHSGKHIATQLPGFHGN